MRPPRLATWLLDRCLEATAREALAGDLIQEYATRAAANRSRARLWLWRQVVLAIVWQRALSHVGERPPAARISPMKDLLRDFTYAIRSLRKSPGFSIVALVILAVGIGANTAIFGAVDAVLLRPLPFKHADRLVVPVSANAGRGIEQGSVSFADYMDWRRETHIFDAVALWRQVSVDLTGEGEPERVQGGQVSEEFFRVTDVVPVAGRLFGPADHAANAARVTVISHELWQRRFGGAPDVVSRSIRIGGTPVEIVGILPPRSVWPDQFALFLPIRPATLNDDVRQRRDNLIFFAVARLRGDATIAQGDAVLATIAARVEAEHPESRKGWTNRLVPLRDYIVQAPVKQALVVLLAAVGAVLLLACANLANLALVRGVGRSRELGVRVALGASRWRLIRQLAVESLVLGIIGGIAGVAIATWMMNGLVMLAPANTPFVGDIRLDARVLIASVVVTGLAVLLAGVLPAIASSAVKPGVALKVGTPGAGASRRADLIRRAIVAGEIAGAVVLLTSAALLIRSFDRIQRVDPGVDADRVLVARLSLPGSRYDTDKRSADFFRQLTERLAQSAGVDAAAATSFVPVGGGGFGLGRVFLREGAPQPPAGPDVSAQWNVVTPEYFRAIGIPVRRGRSFTAQDRADGPPVAIVSQSFATQMFGDGDPLGQRIRSWRDENLLREIVGVVGEVRYTGLGDRGPFRQVYVPHSQNSWGFMNIVVRAGRGTPEDLTPVLRREVAALDAELALANVQTLSQVAHDSIGRERSTALVLSVLAAAALLLGVVGIYGVISYAVSARRHEFGVRIALGATRWDLYGLVFRQGVILTAIGVAIGLGLALAAAQVIGALLYETAATDPASYAATIAVLILSVGIACIIPARRAARSNPVDALKAS